MGSKTVQTIADIARLTGVSTLRSSKQSPALLTYHTDFPQALGTGKYSGVALAKSECEIGKNALGILANLAA